MSTIFRSYQTGEVVFRQGDAGDCAYIIEAGRVEVSISSGSEDFSIATLGEGEIFGEMAVINRLPRSATVTALETTQLCLIPQNTLIERIQAADPVVRLLMLMFIRRTRDMNQTLDQSSLIQQPEIRKALNLIHLRKEVLDQVHFESEIKNAFSQDQFRMNYQPIVELKTGRIAGFEGLIRWHSPVLGIVRPDSFMKIVEESAMMIPVGRWILQQTMKDFLTLRQSQTQDIFISINISPRQLLDPHFISHLERTRANLDLPPQQIKLEITERVFIEGPIAIGVIEKCRALNYQISLDDFGTGYSSISYLKDLSLDTLKIDQSFVRSIQTDLRARSITEATISLATALGLDCVGEGIEAQEIADELMLMGCAYGQGYLFGKPQTLEYYSSKRVA